VHPSEGFFELGGTRHEADTAVREIECALEKNIPASLLSDTQTLQTFSQLVEELPRSRGVARSGDQHVLDSKHSPAMHGGPTLDKIREVVATAWKNVLRLDEVGLNENFFEKGGHSLPAVIISRQIKDALEIRVGAGDIFRYPTVDKLAFELFSRRRG
jgi:acyl carrier protein